MLPVPAVGCLPRVEVSRFATHARLDDCVLEAAEYFSEVAVERGRPLDDNMIDETPAFTSGTVLSDEPHTTPSVVTNPSPGMRGSVEPPVVERSLDTDVTGHIDEV